MTDDSPRSAASAGCMCVSVASDAVRCVLPGDDIAITRMPRNVAIEARLPVWDYQDVLVAALLVRANRAPVWTFERWIDGTDQAGVAVLQGLARLPRLRVELQGVRDRRIVPMPNPLQRKASHVIERLQRWQRWSADEFAAALTHLHHLYPRTHELWIDSASR